MIILIEIAVKIFPHPTGAVAYPVAFSGRALREQRTGVTALAPRTEQSAVRDLHGVMVRFFSGVHHNTSESPRFVGACTMRLHLLGSIGVWCRQNTAILCCTSMEYFARSCCLIPNLFSSLQGRCTSGERVARAPAVQAGKRAARACKVAEASRVWYHFQ